MSLHPRAIELALVLCLLTPAIGGAQAPWTVTVTPTLNPLPVGLCGAVGVTVTDPVTGEVPRRPDGYRITISDFDMTVAPAGGQTVVVRAIDVSHWEVCACQGAAVGAAATITATYPAQALSIRSRVPGVDFQATAPFTLARAKGSLNPSGCSTASRTAVAVAPVTPVATAPEPVAIPTPISREATPVPAPTPPPGPGPNSVSVTGNPAEALVTWSPPDPFSNTGLTGYSVERWKVSDPGCCRVTSPALGTGARHWRDPVMWPGTWAYQVTAIHSDGRRGAVLVNYEYKGPEPPTGLTARQTARDSVQISWQPVQGAAYYVLAGPPSNTAIRVNGTSYTQSGVQLGNNTWKVSSMYVGTMPGGLPVAGAPPVPQQGSGFASVSVDVVNPRYRLVAEAIRVTSETADNQLSEDGKYDEVYVASFAELHLRASPATGGQQLLERQPIRLSAVHGDVTFWLPSERVQAGSASGNGGIRGGDVISPIWEAPRIGLLAGSPLLVLWEGELIPGKHDLILHPMIWEVDQPTAERARDLTHQWCGMLCGWRDFMTGVGGQSSGNHAGAQAAIAGTQIAVIDQDKVWLGTTGGGPLHMERQNRDRPIGLVVPTSKPDPLGYVGDWIDKLVVLSSEKIEAALAAGRNSIEVRFWDHWTIPNTPQTTVSYLNGDYTLVIRIHRVP